MQTTWSPPTPIEGTEPFHPSVPPRPADTAELRSRMEGATLREDHVVEELQRLVRERNEPYPSSRRFSLRRR